MVGRRILLLATLLAVSLPGHAGEVYRWVDAAGGVHFGDHPGPGATRVTIHGSTPPEPPSATVAEVLDGDTLRLTDATRVRLLGIDAPEVARRGRPGQPGGLEARRFLDRLASGRRVRLESDGAEADRYGRRLAYVVLEEDGDVAERLLRAGLVHVALGFGTFARARTYLAAEAAARAAGKGIWALDAYRVLPADGASAYRNTFRRLRLRVERATVVGADYRLETDADLRLYVAGADLAAFSAAGMHPQRLVGRSLVVRGRVRQRDGRPVLLLVTPLQIEDGQ